mgnify:CR=1 FL=1
MDNKKAPSPFAVLWGWASGEHGGFYASVALAVLGVACGMAPYFCVAAMIGLLLEGGGLAECLPWCGLALAGYAGKALFSTWSTSLSHTATYHTLRRVRQNLLSKLSRVPMGTILDTPSGQYKTTIVDRVEGMEPTLAHLLPEMTANVLGPVCILIYLFVLDWRMALLSMVSIPVGMAFMMAVMAGYGKQYEGSVKTTQAMNSAIVEYIGGIEVIKAFNQGKNSYEKFSSRVRSNAAYYYNWMKKCQFGMALAYAIAPTTLITVLPVGWIFYTDGSLSAEVFLTTIILSMSIVGPLIAAMGFVDNLAKVGTIVGSVDEILLKPEQDHGTQPAQLGKPDIALDHVSFGYAQDKEILHNISLTIPAGSLTALVGPSGSGKSTIAKLIAGFWDVTEGRITLGGVEESRIPLEQLYDQVAFVSQDNYLFDDTIRENIRMGRVNATDQEVEQVAKAAGCDVFIRQLEHGYDTRVGGGGAHLSGGERQRIAIARAMLKNAPVVILDEATAYIDPENEAVVQRAVAKLVEGKTVIVIAHRLSTITGADQIVVVKDGSIEAQGRHEELLRHCPLYADLWQAHMGVKEGETV